MVAEPADHQQALNECFAGAQQRRIVCHAAPCEQCGFLKHKANRMVGAAHHASRGLQQSGTGA